MWKKSNSTGKNFYCSHCKVLKLKNKWVCYIFIKLELQHTFLSYTFLSWPSILPMKPPVLIFFWLSPAERMFRSANEEYMHRERPTDWSQLKEARDRSKAHFSLSSRRYKRNRKKGRDPVEVRRQEFRKLDSWGMDFKLEISNWALKAGIGTEWSNIVNLMSKLDKCSFIFIVCQAQLAWQYFFFKNKTMRTCALCKFCSEQETSFVSLLCHTSDFRSHLL